MPFTIERRQKVVGRRIRAIMCPCACRLKTIATWHALRESAPVNRQHHPPPEIAACAVARCRNNTCVCSFGQQTSTACAVVDCVARSMVLQNMQRCQVTSLGPGQRKTPHFRGLTRDDWPAALSPRIVRPLRRVATQIRRLERRCHPWSHYARASWREKNKSRADEVCHGVTLDGRAVCSCSAGYGGFVFSVHAVLVAMMPR